MKKITDFTKVGKDDFSVLRRKMEAALEAIATEHGFKVKAGNASVAPGFCDMKFTFSLVNENGIAENRETMAFNELAHLYGMKKEDLGKTFPYNGKTMKIIGLNTRSKNCVICSDDKGARYGMPPKLVNDLLKVVVNA